MTSSTDREGIRGPLTNLYDVFVDWPGRLGREMPGLLSRLRDAQATRVLDLGCGTGQHVAALAKEGFDAHGADVSEDMLARAREVVDEARLHEWRLGDEPPPSIRALAPFDAVIAMGNVWPFLVAPPDLESAGRSLLEILRPGGALVLGLKAFAVRQESGNPYLPLLKRMHEGRPLWFIRFVDFDVPPAGDVPVCDLHMTIVTGDPADEEREALVHRASRIRSWSPSGLEEWFAAAGFADVSVSGRLDDPSAPATGEDVFVEARAPA